MDTISARPAITSDQNTFFFLSDSYVFRNNPQNIVTFKLEEDGVEAAKIFFSRSGNSIRSLDYSPFGGFILSQRANHDTIAKLIANIEDWCLTNSVTVISIRLYPESYDPLESKLVHRVLEHAAYQIETRELLQVISIDENSIPRFNPNRRRKLRKCSQAGFQFVQLGVGQLGAAYELFTECRSDKNYPITMSLDDLRKAFEKFPDKYLLFGVLDGNTLIAASVCVVVSNRILYDFFPGDKLSLRKFSPLTLLVKGIIEFCLAHEFRLLDLGVSTDERGINIGLQQFKISFGARTDQKLTYYKRINNS